MNEPPRIRPYPHDHPRPQWSVMIPVYNCSEYLTSTLQSVLMQDPGRQQMQIEVVDDASTDTDVKALVRGIAGDRVRYFRQPQNVGSLKNFEACINRASGQLLHILHGDDRVREGYYQVIGSLFERFPEAGAAFCRYDMVDQHGTVIWNHQPEQPTEGLLDNWLLKIARRQRLQFCAVTVKREVYESLGGFYGVSYGEDWEMWTRIAAHYPVAYTPAPLAEYRFHVRSISGRSFLKAENIRDIRWVIAAIGNLVPPAHKMEVMKAASRHYAHYALSIADTLWQQMGSRKAAALQIKEALQLHTDPGMFLSAAKIYLKMLLRRR